MRAQCHFRRSAEGLCAWNVRCLMKLARALPRERVRLSQIRELDEAYWSDEGKQAMTCRMMVEHARLVLESELAYPIVLLRDGSVMDGMHPVCKALFEGREEIDELRFAEDPAPDHVGIHLDELPYEDEALEGI